MNSDTKSPWAADVLLASGRDYFPVEFSPGRDNQRRYTGIDAHFGGNTVGREAFLLIDVTGINAVQVNPLR